MREVFEHCAEHLGRQKHHHMSLPETSRCPGHVEKIGQSSEREVGAPGRPYCQVGPAPGPYARSGGKYDSMHWTLHQ